MLPKWDQDLRRSCHYHNENLSYRVQYAFANQRSRFDLSGLRQTEACVAILNNLLKAIDVIGLSALRAKDRLCTSLLKCYNSHVDEAQDNLFIGNVYH